MTEKRNFNAIGDRLSRELGRYKCTDADFAALLGTTGSAVGKWRGNANGPNFINVRRVAFLLGINLEDMVDGELIRPTAYRHVDLIDTANKALGIINAGFVKNAGLAADVKARMEAYLDSVKNPPQPDNPVLSRETGEALLNMLQPNGQDEPQPDPHDEPPLPMDMPPQPMASQEAEVIKYILKNAETMRERFNLQWVIREDGSLGAKRVTVEEF